MDTRTIHELQLTEMGELVDTFQEITIALPRKNKKYGQDQIERIIRVIQERGLTVPKAAEQCRIPRSSAYNLLNKFNTCSGSIRPGTVKKSKTTPKKLFPEHTEFLIEKFDTNPSITLKHFDSH